MNNDIIVQTSQLTKKFKNIIAVDKLDLNVYCGDIFGFLGPNGAGKSTTIRMMLGLIKPTAGEIKIFDKTLHKNRLSILNKIGALVEKPSFYTYLSARRNLEIFASLINHHENRSIDHVLKIVALQDRADDKVKTYSQGMKQRLGIAQALLGNPEFIILDEPTSGLDPHGMKEIRELITQLAHQGFTIFLSSHLLHEVEQICNKMAIINKGKLIVQGDVDTLLKSGSDLVMITVDNPQQAAELLSAQNWINAVELMGHKLKVTLDQQKIPEMNKLLVNSGFNVFELKLRRTLEDYFLSIVDI